jgi:hypothetical protein
MYNIPRIYPPQEDYFLSITRILIKKDHLWMDTS